MFSPINLPVIKPDWDFDTIESKTFFKRLAMAREAILYKTDKSEIGLQFFKYSRDLFPFGIQLTILDHKEIDISPLSYAEFNDL